MRPTAFTSRCWASTDSIGLFLFVAIWITVWRSAGVIRKDWPLTIRQRHGPPISAACPRSSLVGYPVGGAFLSLAYFDLPYNLVLLVVLRASSWLAENEPLGARSASTAPTSGGATRATSRPRFRI